MSRELLGQLLSLTLGSSLGIISALALRRVIRRLFGAGASYALWLLVPIAMLSVLPPHPHSTAPADPSSAPPAMTSALTHAFDRSYDSLATAESAALDGALLTFAVWGIGAAIFAWYLVGLQRAFVRSLGTVSGLHCVLRAERSVGCPALIGVLRPKVILPADFRERYTRRERLLILSHERTHLRRGDAGWNALVALMRCIFWFNPLVHVAARYFRFDQELACDAAVLGSHRGSRRPYASAILKTQLTAGALPVGCRWQSARDLKERLRMVSRRAPNRRRRLFGRVLTTPLAIAVAYAAWAAQPVAGTAATPVTGASTGGQPGVSWAAGWSGWVSSLNQAPGQPAIIFTHHAQLFFPSGVSVVATADMASSAELQVQGQVRLVGLPISDAQGHPQTTTLEGHVRLSFTSPPVNSVGPRAMIVETNRAVLIGQRDGGLLVQVDEANIHTALLPEAAIPGAPRILPELVTPNSITPNFKDADVSQVAAAVALATHRTISVDPRVRARLNMLSSTPMTPEAFYQAFLDILSTRGFVALPVRPAGNIIRILPGAND